MNAGDSILNYLRIYYPEQSNFIGIKKAGVGLRLFYLFNFLPFLKQRLYRGGMEKASVGRVPLNAPNIAGCSGNSPYISISELFKNAYGTERFVKSSGFYR